MSKGQEEKGVAYIAGEVRLLSGIENDLALHYSGQDRVRVELVYIQEKRRDIPVL